jgi:dsDNA-specific endonuclease/ATPase MutS2
MDKFHQVMKENLKNKKRKIVFIHGVGNGTLKTELRKALDRKYKGHYYQDASFREYGYGATMVII